MNIAFYLNNLSDEEAVNNICQQIYAGLEAKTIKDAAIFFENAAPCRLNIPCATYNSCDMWSFEGSLIVRELEACLKALKVVNNAKIYYYYGSEKINAINLLTMKGINIICNGDESYQEFKRLTNAEPVGISQNYRGIIEVLQ